jgi:hypothetical protein
MSFKDYAAKEKRAKKSVPWMSLTWRMLPVTAVYFCYAWTLWLYLAWIPSFFFHSYGLKLQDSALLSAGGFFAGVVGNTAGGSCGKRARFEGSIVDGLKNKGAAHLDLLPEGRGILLVEFGSDDAARTEKIARKLIERLKLADPRPTTRLYTKTEARHGWHLREAGPRAAAFAPGAVAEWEGEIRLC